MKYLSRDININCDRMIITQTKVVIHLKDFHSLCHNRLSPEKKSERGGCDTFSVQLKTPLNFLPCSRV